MKTFPVIPVYSSACVPLVSTRMLERVFAFNDCKGEDVHLVCHQGIPGRCLLLYDGARAGHLLLQAMGGAGPIESHRVSRELQAGMLNLMSPITI